MGPTSAKDLRFLAADEGGVATLSDGATLFSIATDFACIKMILQMSQSNPDICAGQTIIELQKEFFFKFSKSHLAVVFTYWEEGIIYSIATLTTLGWHTKSIKVLHFNKDFLQF